MKSLLRIALSVTCLVAVATLLECGGGSSQRVKPLIITSAILQNGTAGTQYNQSVQATGGVAPYTWSVSNGTLPHNLQLGSSTTNSDTISGTPDTPVQADAFSLKVTDSASQSATQQYTVSILGLPDTLTLSPASLSFNPQLDGTASATQTATLANTGTSAVAVDSVVSTGNNSADFTQSNTCASGLAPGANCVITVTFTPSQAGPRVASITINDDTTGTPHQLGLNGIGLSSGPNATLSANSLTFNGQEVGSTSPPMTLTLTNYGEAILNVAGIAASGSFLESSTCVTTLAPGANCPINVSFSPTTSGSLNGTLSVTDNATVSPQTVALSGTGMSGGTAYTGNCVHVVSITPLLCAATPDTAQCPRGQLAGNPVGERCGIEGFEVDDSTRCMNFGKCEVSVQ